MHRVKRNLVRLAIRGDDVVDAAVLEGPHVRGTAVVVDDLDTVLAVLVVEPQKVTAVLAVAQKRAGLSGELSGPDRVQEGALQRVLPDLLVRVGLCALVPDGQGVAVYNPENDLLASNPFYSREMDMTKSKPMSILEDRNGNIWICLLQKGLFMQPKAKMDFGYMGDRLGDHNVIGSNCVTSTLVDSHGRTWIGTDKDGLYLMDGSFAAARHFTQCPGTILTMAEDAKGRIWLGSYGQGCGWMDPLTGQWHPVDLQMGSNINVFGLATATNGDVWIATMGNGLVRLNVLSGQMTTFRMQQGADNNHQINSLPNDYLSKIFLTSDQRRLFVASSVGLSCYDIAANSWTNTFGTNCPNYNTFMRTVYADSLKTDCLPTA